MNRRLVFLSLQYTMHVIGSIFVIYVVFLSPQQGESKSPKFSRCELARDLYYNHAVPYSQIPTWVCLAEHVSDLEAISTVKGSYGFWQINSDWWCSEDPYVLDKPCKLPCKSLMDKEIADDVRCLKTIYNEEAKTRDDGDGFHAWSQSYTSKCANTTLTMEKMWGCFDEHTHEVLLPTVTAYQPCELAEELTQKHGIARNEVALYVCIAFHMSRLITSSQRLAHGHGIFQLSDETRCQNGDGKSKDCDVLCDKLRDTDLTDDVACAKKIKRWNLVNVNCTGDIPERILKDCGFAKMPIIAPTTVSRRAMATSVSYSFE